MANTKSAQKAMRQTERRTAQNRAARSAVRTYVKKASLAVTEPSGDGASAAEIVRQAVKALDKAAKRGIIHPNAAARRKSRLMSRMHALTAGPSPTATSEAAPTRGRGRPTAGSTKGTTRSTSTRASSSGTRAPARRTSTKKES
jgi:small subunit ribosomal protein S20